MEAQDGDVVGIIDPMLLEPNHNNDYSTREDQVRVCDAVEATTTEFDIQNSTYEATTTEKKETALEVQEGHGVDDIRSNELQEEMYRAFDDIPFELVVEFTRSTTYIIHINSSLDGLCS